MKKIREVFDQQVRPQFKRIKLPKRKRSVLRYVVLTILLSLAITIAVVLYLWRDEASYQPLFGVDQKVDAAQMMSVLEADQIPYRINPLTGQVMVPSDIVGKARIQLAAKGVTVQIPEGLSLLDKVDPLGVSQFVQDIRFRRGLEGELVQSIDSLKPVASSQVHISIPRTTSFVGSTGEKGSASVMVVLRSGENLNNEQIAAIIKLVSGSVASVPPENVTLVDQFGDLLSARIDPNDIGFGQQNTSDAYRLDLQNNIRALLIPLVGQHNFRSSVMVTLDNDKITETREQYGNAPKLTKEASRDEKTRDQLAVGVPGSLSNRPANTSTTKTNADDDGDSNEAMSKSASARQYTYDRKIIEVKRARGRVERINVAVVLNKDTSHPYTETQIKSIEDSLQSGLGIDTARGDTLVVTEMAFAAVEPMPVWYEIPEFWWPIIQWACYLLMILIFYFLVLRGIAAKWRRSALAKALIEDDDDEDDENALAAQAAADGQPHRKPRYDSAGRLIQDGTVTSLLDDSDLPDEDASLSEMIECLKRLSVQEPSRVAEVIKHWVQRDGQK